MSARFWRINSIDTYGDNTLELSELQLWGATARLDDSVSLVCPVAPIDGALSALQDGTLTNSVSFSRAQFSSAGFSFTWDFGASADVRQVRVGSGSQKARFIANFDLQRSDDGIAWTTQERAVGVAYPGPTAFTSSFAPTPSANDVVYMRFEGANGSASFTDQCGHTFTGYGAAAVTTAGALSEGSSLKLDGNGSYLQADPNADFNIGSGSFAIDMAVSFDDISRRQPLVSKIYSEYNHQTEFVLFWEDSYFRFYYGNRGYYGVIRVFQSPIAIEANKRYRIRFGRNSDGVMRLFVEGAQSPTPVADNFDFSEPSTPFFKLTIGAILGGPGDNYYYKGLIDDLVIRKNVGPGNVDYVALDLQKCIAQQAYGASGKPSGATTVVVGAAPLATQIMPVTRAVRARDMEFGGRGHFLGTVKAKGSPNVPVHRRIRLVRDRDALLVRETWSDATTGAWSFSEIDETKAYTIEASDYEGNYRTVVASNVIPGLMP